MQPNSYGLYRLIARTCDTWQTIRQRPWLRTGRVKFAFAECSVAWGIWVTGLATFLAFFASTNPAFALPYLGAGVFETGRLIPDTNRYFVQVMAGESEAAARVRYQCIRTTQPSLPAAIYRLPSSTLDATRQPYGVVIGSYLSEAEAAVAVAEARSHFDFAATLRCLGVPARNLVGAVNLAKKQITVRELSATPAEWAAAIERTPVAAFDKVGPRRIVQDDKPRAALVEGVRYPTAEAVSAALGFYRNLAPQVHFVVIQHGHSYLLSVTDLLTCDVQTDNVEDCWRSVAGHVQELRRHGLYAIQSLAIFSPGASGLLTDTTVRLVNRKGEDLPWDAPTKTTGVAMATNVLEDADLFDPLQARVLRCYTGKITRLDTLASCSGVILSPLALTNCLLDGICQGERVPIGYLQERGLLLRTCLAVDTPNVAMTGILDAQMACQGLSLEPALVSVIDKIGLRSCWRDGTDAATKCNEAKVSLFQLCSDPAQSPDICRVRPEVVEVMQRRVQRMLDCLDNMDHCGGIAVDASSVRIKVAEEAQRMTIDLDRELAPIVAGLGGLAGTPQEVVARFKACRDLKVANNPSAHDCFVGIGMSQANMVAMNCLKSATDDLSRLKCTVPEASPEAQAIERAKCAADAGQDLDKLAMCAGGDATKLKQAYDCSNNQTSLLDTALNCTDGAPPDLVVAVRCAKESAGGNYSACLPNIGEKGQIALCLTRAVTDAQKLDCVAAKVPLDARTVATMTCLSKSNGNGQAMAACAIVNNVPPEAAKAVQCASQATGAVSFALCATGAGMNAEMRIAAECAASTGGEPLSFAGCTAGRLTTAELTKCMSGEIGTDGGCFGPNNTIVKTVNNVFKDVTAGLGPDNDLVKTFGPVTEALKSVGGRVSEGLQHIGREAKRGDVGRTICNWLGC